MIILRLLLLLTNLHLKLLSTQGTGADKLLSTQRVKVHIVLQMFYVFQVSSSNASTHILPHFTCSPLPLSCNTFMRKGCNRFKILLQFQIFGIKSNENMIWACDMSFAKTLGMPYHFWNKIP